LRRYAAVNAEVRRSSQELKKALKRNITDEERQQGLNAIKELKQRYTQFL